MRYRRGLSSEIVYSIAVCIVAGLVIGLIAVAVAKGFGW